MICDSFLNKAVIFLDIVVDTCTQCCLFLLKVAVFMLLYCYMFQHMFSKNKTVFLYNHNAIIKFREFTLIEY